MVGSSCSQTYMKSPSKIMDLYRRSINTHTTHHDQTGIISEVQGWPSILKIQSM